MTRLRPVDGERQRAFERALAERYDSEFSSLTLWPGHRQWWLGDMGCQHEARILNFLEYLDGFVRWHGKVCVDLGCGSGASLIALEALGAEAFGVDNQLVGADLAFAKLRAAVYGLELDLVDGDATNLPLPDASVDIALSTSVAEHVEDICAYVREAYRLLRTNGTLVFATDNRASLRESHTRLWLAHWLPRPFFETLARRKLGLPPKTPVHVYPRTFLYYRRLARQIGFRVVADRWDVFLARPHSHSKPLKRWVAQFCKRTGFPLELILPGTLLILEKP